jgi:nicotinate-nucleotide pyrophosphorylase (carboxylating)
VIIHKPALSEIRRQVCDALREDLGGSLDCGLDITAGLIPEHQQATATIITREPMVVCGLDWVYASCEQVDRGIQVNPHVREQQCVEANTVLLTLKGNARALLSAERTVLNFLQFLSGTATTTSHYVKALRHSNTKILDTRKTIPGFRLAQKYAVACGGGTNHRVGVYDAFLIKENHIAACGGIAQAVKQAQYIQPNAKVEVEVENFDELHQALDAKADIVMLDNFTTEQVSRAVAIVQGRCKLEVSGNITIERLRELAATGVDFISSGALTKHVQAIDLSMRFQLV